MSSVTGDSSLNLERDVERAVLLLDRLRTTSEIPENKLIELQRIFQSDFFRAVMEVYEKIYDTVHVSGSPEVRANATAKATVCLLLQRFVRGFYVEMLGRCFRCE